MRKGDVISYLQTEGVRAWYIFIELRDGKYYHGTEDYNLYAKVIVGYAYKGIQYLLPKEFIE